MGVAVGLTVGVGVTVGVAVSRLCGVGVVNIDGVGELQAKIDKAVKAARPPATQKAADIEAEVVPICSAMNLRSLLQLQLNEFILLPRE
jgi:deoxyinosine 3'endonuclease (endonuclease V)